MPFNRRIRVLQLVEGLNLGGAETKLLELVSHMDQHRFETIVCSLGLGDRLVREVQKLGVRVVNFPRRSRFDLRLVLDVARLIRSERIDVVMSTLFYADVVAALAGALNPQCSVISWETISAPEWLVWRRLLAYRAAMHFCDRVVSVSEATAKWLVEQRGLSRRKIVVIPYGVNLEVYRYGKDDQVRQELGLHKDIPVVGVVARLHPQKGHRFLIKAATQIVTEHPQVKFVLVGDGVLRSELENRVDRDGLKDHFLFLGFRRDVHRIMRAFDLFVLPSLYEGLPNVVLEAMAVGLPVVATAVDGTPELVVDGETGYLVPPADPQALAERICALLYDRRRATDFGSQGRRRVEANFSLEKQVQRFQNLYAHFALNGAASDAGVAPSTALRPVEAGVPG